jgi:pimeloyl-ACP methyl ester carboxylesterase
MRWGILCLLLWGACCRADSFDANGVKIHYVVEGAGEPVVLIHGLGSSARINWQWPGTFAALARDHRVIALDLPWRNDGLQMVEDVILLLDHLKIRRAHIVGYSMGGMIALKLIAEHPDRVLSGAIGGMGWLREGSGLQKFWRTKGLGKLALTREDLISIHAPMEVLVGSLDPVRNLYVSPLQAARSDWPVIEIHRAGHLTCVFKKEFTEELVSWVDRNSQ